MIWPPPPAAARPEILDHVLVVRQRIAQTGLGPVTVSQCLLNTPRLLALTVLLGPG